MLGPSLTLQYFLLMVDVGHGEGCIFMWELDTEDGYRCHKNIWKESATVFGLGVGMKPFRLFTSLRSLGWRHILGKRILDSR
jgi:hypothetical protein